MQQPLLSPLGFRLDGRPVWLFSGGEGEGDGGGGNSGGDGGQGGDGDGGDGDGGTPNPLQVALDQERGKVGNVRKELRGWKAPLAAAGIRSVDDLASLLEDYQALKTGGQQQQNGNGNGGQQNQPPVDVEKIRREVAAEVTLTANREVALAKIEAMATKVFADAGDAVVYLRSQVDDLLDDNGKPDTQAITTALTELLRQKPHLGVKKEAGTDFEGGARQTAGAATNMNDFLRTASRNKRGV